MEARVWTNGLLGLMLSTLVDSRPSSRATWASLVSASTSSVPRARRPGRVMNHDAIPGEAGSDVAALVGGGDENHVLHERLPVEEQ